MRCLCVWICVCVCVPIIPYTDTETHSHTSFISTYYPLVDETVENGCQLFERYTQEWVREWAKFSHYCYSPPPPPLTRAQVTNHKIKLQLVSNHRRNLFNLFRFTDPFLEHANVHVRDAPVAFYPKFFFFHPSPNITAKREGHKVFCFSHVIHKITLKMEWLWQRSSSECFMVPKKKLMCAFFRWLLLFSLLVEILFTKSTT